jgi:Domain of unknown function (DUF5664)/Domain of unknown function (DUF4406)
MNYWYISGPMRGIPKYNFPLFDELRDELKLMGFQVVSPADHDREVEPNVEETEHYAKGDPSFNANGSKFHQLIGWDLRMIAHPDCAGIVLLPGWENSTGAQHERYVAEACGKKICVASWHVPDWSEVGFWRYEEDEDRSLSRKRGMRIEGEDIEKLEGASNLQPDQQLASWTRPQPTFSIHDDEGNPLQPTPVPVIELGHQFTTKDSGVRAEFDSGMVRDTDAGKPRYDLIPTLPLKRLAELYARGAIKYGEYNWQKANSHEELARFKASAFRHLIQALDGDTDEDHLAAVAWNVFAVMWLQDKLANSVTLMGETFTDEEILTIVLGGTE